MQLIQLDKKKSPEVADWAADKEPGDRVCLYGSIKSNDDQTLGVTFEEIGDEPAEKEKDDEEEKPEGGNIGSGDVVAEGMVAEDEDV